MDGVKKRMPRGNDNGSITNSAQVHFESKMNGMNANNEFEILNCKANDILQHVYEMEQQVPSI